MAYQNFFTTRLSSDIGAADTTIGVETVPSATSGRLVIEARNSTQREIISYTGIAGNTLTGVTRGIGGTDAKTHTKNALVEMNLTAEDLQEIWDYFGTDPVSIDGAKLATGTVPGTALANDTVTPDKLNLTKSTDANGWNIVNVGDFKIYTQRFTGSTSSLSSLGSASVANGNYPVGVAPSSVKHISCQPSMSGAQDRYVFSVSNTSSVTTGAAMVVVARNVTSATISDTVGVTVCLIV